jgi:hypothetical protein
MASSAVGMFVMCEVFCVRDGYEWLPRKVTGKVDSRGYWQTEDERGELNFVHPKELKDLQPGATPKFPIGTKIQWDEVVGGGRDYFTIEGTIVGFKVWCNRVSYNLKPNDGGQIAVCDECSVKPIASFKPPQPTEQELLRQHEARLLAELASVQSRLQRL